MSNFICIIYIHLYKYVNELGKEDICIEMEKEENIWSEGVNMWIVHSGEKDGNASLGCFWL